MDDFQNILRVCKNSFLKWHKNIRVILVFLLIAIFMFSSVQGVKKLAIDQNMAVTPWVFPFLFKISYNQVLFFLPLIFLFCDAPFFDEQFPYICMRAKRPVWAKGQVLYIFLASLLFTAALYFFSILFLIPNLSFSLEWGKIIRMLSMGSISSQEFISTYGMGIGVSASILSNYMPLQATAISLLLTWLDCVFLGLLMFLVNLRFPRGLGAIIASIFVCFTFFVSQFSNGFSSQYIYYFSPVSWSNLENIKIRETEIRPTFTYAVCVLFALIVILSFTAVHAMKNRDIEVLPEV